MVQSWTREREGRRDRRSTDCRFPGRAGAGAPARAGRAGAHRFRNHGRSAVIEGMVGQERAIRAISFGAGVNGDGFNIFTMGAPRLGSPPGPAHREASTPGWRRPRGLRRFDADLRPPARRRGRAGRGWRSRRDGRGRGMITIRRSVLLGLSSGAHARTEPRRPQPIASVPAQVPGRNPSARRRRHRSPAPRRRRAPYTEAPGTGADRRARPHRGR